VSSPWHEDEGGEAPCFAHLIEEGLLDVVTDGLALDARAAAPAGEDAAGARDASGRPAADDAG